MASTNRFGLEKHVLVPSTAYDACRELGLFQETAKHMPCEDHGGIRGMAVPIEQMQGHRRDLLEVSEVNYRKLNEFIEINAGAAQLQLVAQLSDDAPARRRTRQSRGVDDLLTQIPEMRGGSHTIAGTLKKTKDYLVACDAVPDKISVVQQLKFSRSSVDSVSALRSDVIAKRDALRQMDTMESEVPELINRCNIQIPLLSAATDILSAHLLYRSRKSQAADSHLSIQTVEDRMLGHADLVVTQQWTELYAPCWPAWLREERHKFRISSVVGALIPGSAPAGTYARDAVKDKLQQLYSTAVLAQIVSSDVGGPFRWAELQSRLIQAVVHKVTYNLGGVVL